MGIVWPIGRFKPPMPYYNPYDVSGAECCAQKLVDFQHLIGVLIGVLTGLGYNIPGVYYGLGRFNPGYSPVSGYIAACYTGTLVVAFATSMLKKARAM